MQKRIQSALISVFNKDGLDTIVRLLHEYQIIIYSTGGTQTFITSLGIPCVSVESLTHYPSILGGRVKTLHPSIFGGILADSANMSHMDDMRQYNIPAIDLVIVDMYPFEETIATTSDEGEIIEKIDIGGTSMIRAAAKNYRELIVIASKSMYPDLEHILSVQKASTTIAQRRLFAAKAFEIVAHYDVAVAKYFQSDNPGHFFVSTGNPISLRYGENPHQTSVFFGKQEDALFEQLGGKELSYNNLVDIDAAIQLIAAFDHTKYNAVFAILKHTNVCGAAARSTSKEAWDAAFAGDPESAFGGVLICNTIIDVSTAEAIHEVFFEVLVAPAFTQDALDILCSRKKRILLQWNKTGQNNHQYKSLLNGVLLQSADNSKAEKWEEVGARATTETEKSDLEFANIICKHLKSNAIALVKNRQLIGKGCGQTSRIDALRQAIEKAKQFHFDLHGAALASDAFFPFNDCVQMAHHAGITAFIQPGGSIRDDDSIAYCKNNDLAMVITGIRHFRH